MRIRHSRADVNLGEEKTEENKRNKGFPRLEGLIERSKELAQKAAMITLVSATVVFTACGSPDEKPTGDADTDSDVAADIQNDESDAADSLEMEDGETDSVEDSTDDSEDVEAEEMEPVCPTAVEETVPDLNDILETDVYNSNTFENLAGGEGEITAVTETHMSMSVTGMLPDEYNECINPDMGAYEIKCTGEGIEMDGEYFIKANEIDGVIPAVSSFEGICSPIAEDYPVVAYTSANPETIRNMTYDFGGSAIDSIAGVSIQEITGFYFDIVDESGLLVSHAGSHLSFTPTTHGIYAISYTRTSTSDLVFNVRGFDGIGNEEVYEYGANITAVGRSNKFYMAAVNSTDNMHYSVEGIPSVYGNTTYGIVICTRLLSGVRTDSITLALDELEGASSFNILCPIENDDCGCIGKEVALSLSNIVSSGIPIGGEMTAVPSLVKASIESPNDIPEVQIDYTYSGTGSIGLDLDISVSMTLNIDGTNACTGGEPFHEHYRFTITAWDPASEDYLAECGGAMDPST